MRWESPSSRSRLNGDVTRRLMKISSRESGEDDTEMVQGPVQDVRMDWWNWWTSVECDVTAELALSDSPGAQVPRVHLGVISS